MDNKQYIKKWKTSLHIICGMAVLCYSFSSPSHADTLINPSGTTVTNFMGTANDDTITNEYGATISNLLNTSQGGNDTLINSGVILFILASSGNDTVTNTSSGVIDLIASGDGIDTITNNGTVNLIINSGNGDDIITNNSTINGNIGGEGDDDIIINNGAVSGYIAGGNDNDTITNYGTITEYISGDHGDDTVTNETSGHIAEDITGGYGDDIVINYGTVDGDTEGGSGDDIIYNYGTTKYLKNQSGSDTIYNYGTVTSKIRSIYPGSNDTIYNYGDAGHIEVGYGNDVVNNISTGSVGSIELGEGDDELNNYGTITSYIMSDTGDDTINNFSNGSISYHIILEEGNDTLVNAGYIGTYILGGDGNDTLELQETGTIGGDVSSFETVSLTGTGTKTIGGDADFSTTTSTLIEVYNTTDTVLSADNIDLGHINNLTVNFMGTTGSGLYTLIDTANGITGNFDSITTNLGDIYNYTFSISGTDFIAEITRKQYEDNLMSLSNNAQNTAEALSVVANTATGDLKTVTDSLDDLINSPDELASKIEELTPKIHTTTTQVQTTTSGAFSSLAQNRLASIKSGQTNYNYTSYCFDPNTPECWPVLASISETPENLFNKSKDGYGIFFKTLGQVSKQSSYNGNIGYKSNTIATYGGFDKEFSKNLVGGLSLGYAKTKTKFRDEGQSSSKMDSYQIGFYGSYFKDNWFIDSNGSYSKNKHASNRRMPSYGTAVADFDGSSLYTNVTAGYNIQKDNFTITPLASIDISKQSTEEYTEIGSSAPLTVKKNTINSFKTGLGIQTTSEIEHELWNIKPAFNIMWQKEFEESNIISSEFAASPGQTFSTSSANTGDNNLKIGMSIAFETETGQMLLDYQTNLRKHFSSHTLMFKINHKF